MEYDQRESQEGQLLVEKGQFLTSVTLRFSQGVNIEALGVVHSSPDAATVQKIERFVHDCDFVAVETDITYLSGGLSVEASGFSDVVFKEAWKARKMIVCTDPLAETEDYSLLDIGVMFALFAMFSLFSLSFIENAKSKKLSRRNFFKTLGILGTLGAMRGTAAGEALELLLVGTEGSIHHPGLTDAWSYEEFRNASTFLGLELLIKKGVIPKMSHGCLFIGDTHINDFRGYTSDGSVDMGKATHVYKNNLYANILSQQGVVPTARVWSPQTQENVFALQQYLLKP